jgi:hypothetical protein
MSGYTSKTIKDAIMPSMRLAEIGTPQHAKRKNKITVRYVAVIVEGSY